jgi:hypothetical protein
MRITHVGPVSVAKIGFVLYAVIGLIIGLFFAAFSMLGAAAGAGDNEVLPFAGALFGVGAIVTLPLLYGGFAAISGLFFAWLYNVIAGIVGGVEIRTDGPTA